MRSWCQAVKSAELYCCLSQYLPSMPGLVTQVSTGNWYLQASRLRVSGYWRHTDTGYWLSPAHIHYYISHLNSSELCVLNCDFMANSVCDL